MNFMFSNFSDLLQHKIVKKTSFRELPFSFKKYVNCTVSYEINRLMVIGGSLSIFPKEFQLAKNLHSASSFFVALDLPYLQDCLVYHYYCSNCTLFQIRAGNRVGMKKKNERHNADTLLGFIFLKVLAKSQVSRQGCQNLYTFQLNSEFQIFTFNKFSRT